MLAATLAAAGLAQRVAAQPAAVPPALGQHVAAYSAAWGSRDPARIPALHTADTVFDLRVDGETPAVGRQAAQAQFARILRDNPGYASTVGKVGFGPDFVVIEYTIAMDPAVPFALGRFCYQPTGVAYTVPAIDVIRFREGLVSEKVTFLDTEVIRANSRDTVALKAGR
ncbi:nuclear transport factor 2 family protein [Polymorphobacter multimanifer]|uniref:Ketosteroid isomerase-like protein n=1 Tax=Polymorphobacter multimanifer TaxID=1070431 RepID=A0A841LKM3_9SPHN|nr:nuclear transport factor 2 family protein [Polymorphobacter multimanifer]MBB6229528.1 ketosteroid isomerase-like protein [Polymorphobacter multimanifer]